MEKLYKKFGRNKKNGNTTFVFGFVGKHGAMYAVANGIDVGNDGLKMRVDRNSPFLVFFYSESFQS